MRSDGRSFNIQDSLQPESGVEPGRLKWVIRQLEVRNTPAHFIRDLANAGMAVGTAKITGTDYPKDNKYFRDAGV